MIFASDKTDMLLKILNMKKKYEKMNIIRSLTSLGTTDVNSNQSVLQSYVKFDVI